MTKVFIDGSAGTTGLRIHQRLAQRQDITLLTLSEELRKDDAARQAALNECDIAFLCLPDAAAKQAAALVTDPDTVIIDASTAHRTAPSWAYGFPELGDSFAQAVKNGKRIAVPGCHASGFIALVQPLVSVGLLAKDALLPCHSVTGYSGGGKAMIAQYENSARSPLLPIWPEPAAQAPAGDAGHHRAGIAAHLLPHRGGFLQRHGGDNSPVCQPAEGQRGGCVPAVPMNKTNKTKRSFEP